MFSVMCLWRLSKVLSQSCPRFKGSNHPSERPLEDRWNALTWANGRGLQKPNIRSLKEPNRILLQTFESRYLGLAWLCRLRKLPLPHLEALIPEPILPSYFSSLDRFYSSLGEYKIHHRAAPETPLRRKKANFQLSCISKLRSFPMK